ncbi:hypothetical protein BJY00DRAFT_316228 [Aspergillus carlsbadensis]|nr:hypothetical protein BJY00DRAFT_316228 [Aspergillus carlsbadensis]
MSCESNGRSCLHCSYREDTYPVVFKCQFIYRYEEHPTEYTSHLQDKLVEALAAHFKRTVPIYGHFKSHQFSLEDEPVLWMSFLVDLPLNAKVDKKLETLLFEDRTPSSSDWKIILPKQADHPNLERLEWFMARAGISHYKGCFEAIRIIHDNN